MNCKHQGFTLLEAVVALVLIATAGMALLDWVNNNLMNLNRVQTLQQRNEAIRSALVFMESVNPRYRHTEVETVTSTMVQRMQMFARPFAFCFIR